MGFVHSRRWFVVVVCFGFLPISGLPLSPFLLSPSQAQITLDGSLGPSGPLTGPDYTIGADVGQLRGDNLFHSFGEFNVQTGESATFTGPDAVENVIGRVTGGNQSFIDGSLRSTIPDANLYLLNPSGVMFGENATLDVQGSFHVSTADYLKMTDGAEFSADLGGGSVLSAAAPEAFGFLGQNPAGISIDGSALQVPEGETLSVVGGDIEIRGSGAFPFDDQGNLLTPPSLGAPSGRINIVSVASAGEVISNPAGEHLDLNVDSFESLGEIDVSEGAFIETSGESGGTVVIRGGQLMVDDAAIFANTNGDIDGAAVGIDIDIANEMIVTDGAFITADVFGRGTAGNLTITAGQLEVRQGAEIGAGVFGMGQGGTLTIIADRVLVDGMGPAGQPADLFTQADPGSSGDAGDLTITAGQLEVRQGAQISASTFGMGQGGTLTIIADRVLVDGMSPAGQPAGLFTQADPGSSGDAGDLTITAGQLEVRAGALISTRTFGAGQGGNLVITADQVLVDGAGQFAGLFANTEEGSSGAAGDLTIAAGQLEVRQGALISTATFGAGQGGTLTIIADRVLVDGAGQFTGLFTDTGSSGAAGDLTIAAGQLEVRDGAGITTRTFSAGQGGNLVITADHVLLDGVGLPGGLFASAEEGSSGAAGDLTIAAGQLEVRDGAEITTRTFGAGQGGNLVITADHVLVDGVGQFAGLFTNAAPGSSGAAGDLTITAGQLEVRDGALIITGTGSSGAAGDLTITAGQLVVRQDAGISTGTLGAGQGGNLVITAGQLEVRDGAVIATGTSGSGQAGDLVITADHVLVDGVGQFPLLVEGVEISPMSPSALLASTGPGSSGAAGDLTITADQLEVRRGAQIFTGTFGAGQGGNLVITADRVLLDGAGQFIAGADQFIAGAGLSTGLFTGTTPGSSGAAGDLTITAGQLEVREGARIDAATLSSGRGGNIQITATDITLEGAGSSILATSSSTEPDAGESGSIRITADNTLNLRNGGRISLETERADAGDIELQVGTQLVLRNDSRITTSVADGQGNGGNILMRRNAAGDPTQFVILDDSTIEARAFEGRGGNITIVAEVFLASPESIVDASSETGIDGEVNVSSPVTEISGTFAPLPETFLQAAALLRQQCAERLGEGQVDSFVVRGRDGVPLGPESVLPSRSTLKGQEGTQAKGKDTGRRQPRTRRSASVPPPAQQALLEKIGHTDALIVRCGKLAR